MQDVRLCKSAIYLRLCYLLYLLSQPTLDCEGMTLLALSGNRGLLMSAATNTLCSNSPCLSTIRGGCVCFALLVARQALFSKFLTPVYLFQVAAGVVIVKCLYIISK